MFTQAEPRIFLFVRRGESPDARVGGGGGRNAEDFIAEQLYRLPVF